MNPERWQQISRIFKSAISLDDTARAAYVKEKCGADDDLRQEVERLIESHREAGGADFIGGVAVEDLAEHFTEHEDPRVLKDGQQFGAYSILNYLGAGGMGQVYLARDSRLGRTVALKILSSDIAGDKRRMQRFRQEAKVASSLNQPNILTIFEFGEVDELTFLAAEFVDGETLRDHLRGKRLKLSEILDISTQILAALDAAHEANIVHRDMKPENVMIRRRDHVVKVLDFGLAKITEKKTSRPNSLSSDEEAVTAFKTAPGLIMGTVNYMSPEQAQAKNVDARSDIWSVGIMIYEMVAGAKPFGGSTSAHTIVEILEKDPAPLTHAGVLEVPAELQRIVGKAIAKDRDERYQTAKDMLIDLRNLKRRLEVTAEIDRERTRSMEYEPRKTPARSRAPLMALVAVVLVVAGVLAFVAVRNMRNRPVVQPGNTAAAEPAPAAQRTITYWITVQKFKNGRPFKEPFDMPGEINFEEGYRIRLSIRSPQPGYLYVLNEGPLNTSGHMQYVAVFPSPTANNGSEFLSADQAVKIPEKSWLRFDKEQGVEKLWLVFSENSVPELAGMKPFATPRTEGLITDDNVNKSIFEFLKLHSTENVAREKGETLTTLTHPGKVLVYPIRLEHH